MKSAAILRLAVVASALLVVPPASAHEIGHENDHEIGHGIATVVPTEGNSVAGTVTFTAVDDGVRVQAQLTGLTEGRHGFHVHQWGDCSAPDGTSAGGHFNPHGSDHAGPDADRQHVGDLGNITADADGTASYDAVIAYLAFSGENNIIGRGLIVHADEDDLVSQPTGAAGARQGCGVIGIDAAPQPTPTPQP